MRPICGIPSCGSAHLTVSRPPARLRLQASLRCAALSLSSLLLLAAAPGAGAQSLTGNLNATMRISTGCVISGAAPGSNSGLNFGTLDFGTHPATFTGTVDAQPTGGAGGTGNTQILCSADITVISVTVGAGLHPGQGSALGAGSRAMQSGTNYIPYEVYQDPAHSIPYPTTAVNSIPVTAPGSAFALPIYGRVSKPGAQTLPFGVYTDTLAVTVAF